MQAKGRAFAVVIIIAMSTMVYSGTFIGMNRVATSTDRFYEELGLFDVDFRFDPAMQSGLPDLDVLRKDVGGIERATYRLSSPALAEFSGNRIAGVALSAVSPDVRPAL